MILRLFKSNHPYVIFLIPILGFVLWIPSFFQTTNELGTIQLNNYPFLYHWLYRTISPYPVLFKALGLLLIILQSYFLIRMNFKFIFFEQKTYLSSVLFVLFSSALVNYQTLHPVVIGNLFLLFAIDRAFVFEKKANQFQRYFEAGLFIGLGSLFYPNLIFYLVTIWLTLFLLRTFNWREWFSTLIGLFTPWAFYLAILFINNSQIYSFDHYLEFFTNNLDFLSVPLASLIAAIIIAFVLVISLISSMGHVTSKKISTRKYFNLFFLFLLNSIVLVLAGPAVGFETIVISAVPASVLLGTFLINIRSNWVSELFFDLVLLSVLTLIWIR